MRVKSSVYLRSVGSLLTILLFSVCAAAQHTTAQPTTEAQPTQQLTDAQRQSIIQSIRIRNFGQMDERFYRGARPRNEEDFRALAALGIRTVIDLQAEAKPEERAMVEALGMRYVNIPMRAKTYPTEEQVATFLRLVDDPSTGTFYLHCAGGRHRTGALGAVYRFNRYGWNYEQVYAEMERFDFYTRWGHGDYKRFVQDYWRRVQTNGHTAAPAAAPATTGQ